MPKPVEKKIKSVLDVPLWGRLRANLNFFSTSFNILTRSRRNLIHYSRYLVFHILSEN